MATKNLLRMGKKATSIFTVLIVLAGLVALTWTFTILLKQKNDFSKEVGSEQQKIFDSYQLGENILFYLDESARYSSYSSAFVLVSGKEQSRLFPQSSECGAIDGVPFWTKADISCYPDLVSAKAAYTILFNESMNRYAHAYLPAENTTDYLLEFKDASVSASPVPTPAIICHNTRYIDITRRKDAQDLIVTLADKVEMPQDNVAPSSPVQPVPANPSQNEIGILRYNGEWDKNLVSVYSVKHDFAISQTYDLMEYVFISEKAKLMVSDVKACAAGDTALIAGCVKSLVPIGWEVTYSEDPQYSFLVKGKRLPMYDPTSKKVIDKEVEYRFALEFLV